MKFRALTLFILLEFLIPVNAGAKEINLRWKAIKGAEKYDLEVAQDTGFNKVVFSKTVKVTSVPKELPSGMYYLRVRGIDEKSKAGKWSTPFQLVVTAPVNPMAKVSVPQKITYVAKAPELDSTWKVKDKATAFKVALIKDGKEVQSKETAQPKADFHPTEPGDYKIAVSAGYNGYFGPAVTVEEINVEQKQLVPPAIKMPAWKRYDSRHTIKMKWMPSPDDEAKGYVVKIYNAKDYSGSGHAPASAPVAEFPDLKTSELKVPPLPPGRYVASVQSISTDDSLSTATTYPLDINRGKPVEFEKFDLTAGYEFTGVQFESNIIEAGSNISSSSLGSAITANGNLWFYDSSFGMRVGGSFNNFVANGSPITNSDLMIAGQYRFTSADEGLHSALTPFLGIRAWTLPIITANNNNGGGNNNSAPTGFQEFSSTLFGPVLGLNFVRPISDKVALVAAAQLAIPVTASKIGGGQLSNLTLASNPDPSPKIQAGVKIALSGGMRLFAMAGYEENNADFNPFAGSSGPNGPSGTPPPGVQDSVKIKYPMLTLGVESASDGSGFRSNTMAAPPAEVFSYFNFTTSYTYAPVNYTATYIENTASSSNGAPNFDLDGANGGFVNFEANGFFKDSHSGMRLAAGWDGFPYEGTNVMNPEFTGQWGYRPRTTENKDGWNWNDYLGLRLWRIPIFGINSGFYTVDSPQLLGPVDTFTLTKGLGSGWSMRLLAELSTPVLLTDKSSVIDHSLASAPSGRTELDAIRAVTADLSFGLGAGFRMDQLQYAPSSSESGTTFSSNSSVQITTPTVSFFGTYSF